MIIFKRNIAFFVLGAYGYGLIELLWRGHTHWTMLIAGGICFMCFSRVAEKFKKRSLAFKAVLCSLIITTVELIFGMVFNVALKMEIWDYSSLPFNLFGQICPLFSLAWTAFGFLFIPLAEKLNDFFLEKFD